jgi:hypothetical protein
VSINQQYIVREMNEGKSPKCPYCGEDMFWHGDWYCESCLERDRWEDQNAEADYWEQMRLCTSCKNFINETCRKYPEMRPRFFGRKNRCKYYDHYSMKKQHEDSFDIVGYLEDAVKNGRLTEDEAKERYDMYYDKEGD